VAVTSLEPIPDTTRLVLRGAYFLNAERGKGEGGDAYPPSPLPPQPPTSKSRPPCAIRRAGGVDFNSAFGSAYAPFEARISTISI
jgi:hypothetical protein